MADIDNVTVGENNYNLRDSAAQNALPTQGQVDDIIEALDIIAVKSNTPYNASNKLPTDYADDTNQTHKFATAAQLSQIETNENNILSIYDTGYAQKNVMRIVLDEVKALLPSRPFVGNTTTFGNLSVTFNEDNSITLNGSHTAAVAINFKDLSHINMPTDAVGAASANITLSNDIFFGLWGDSGVSNLVLNDGVDIPSDYASKYSRGFVIRVSANTVCNNVRIYPMVCDKALYQASSEVVPYALSNTTITPALKECVDNGVKNLLDFSGSTPIAPPNCTMTNNGDGTYTVTKTSENLDTPYIAAQLKAGTYIYSGCPAGGSDSTYRLDIRTSTGSVVGEGEGDYGSGVKVTIPSDGWYRITCRLNSTYTTTGLTIKPMLCDPALWAISPTFEPHAMSNAELTAKEQTNENNISYLANNSVKNIFHRDAGIYNHSNIKFTTNADGSISLSGTANGDAVLTLSDTLDTTDDTYILYGDGFISGVFMDTYETGYTNRRTFTSSVVTNSNTKIWRLIVNSGTNVNGVTIRPMLCKKSLFDADRSYQPYAMSNAELTAKEQTNENNILLITPLDTEPTQNSVKGMTSGGLYTEFTKTLRKQSTLSANDDLNSATSNGIYKFNGGPANNPAVSTGAYGILLVITFDNYTMQLCYDFVNGVYYRNKVSSWSAWTKFN